MILTVALDLIIRMVAVLFLGLIFTWLTKALDGNRSLSWSKLWNEATHPLSKINPRYESDRVLFLACSFSYLFLFSLSELIILPRLPLFGEIESIGLFFLCWTAAESVATARPAHIAAPVLLIERLKTCSLRFVLFSILVVVWVSGTEGTVPPWAVLKFPLLALLFLWVWSLEIALMQKVSLGGWLLWIHNGCRWFYQVSLLLLFTRTFFSFERGETLWMLLPLSGILVLAPLCSKAWTSWRQIDAFVLLWVWVLPLLSLQCLLMTLWPTFLEAQP